MSTRTVTATILQPDGSAWAGTPIVFELLQLFETATEIYPIKTYTKNTDTNGAISITLGVPTNGTAKYRVNLPDGSAYEFNLGAGGTIDLVTIIAAATPYTAPTQLQTLLDSHIATYFQSGTWNPFATSTPTSHGFATNPTGAIARYHKVDKHCKVWVEMPNRGTSNGNTFIIDAPFTAATVTGMSWGGLLYGISNNSGYVAGPGYAKIYSGLSQIALYLDVAGQTT